MIEYSIGVVGHVDRLDMARTLAEDTHATLLNLDNGSLGCLGNHAYVQTRLVSENGWSVILEDDAVPMHDFSADLEHALRLTESYLPPSVKILSLYLGTGYPAHWQKRIGPALEVDACFIDCPELLHAVGYAVAPDIKDELASWLSGSTRMRSSAPDYLMSMWLAARQYRVAYTNPSLVDHRDVRTVIRARSNTFAPGRNRPRQAHNTTQRLTWTASCVTMDRYGKH